MKTKPEINFDHFVIATVDLDDTVTNLEKKLKYPFSNGGEHKIFGTHNRLFRLDDVYLEVIAINPLATPLQQPRWFELDNFSGEPRIVTWIANTTNILSLLPNIWAKPGEIQRLSRDNLEWDFTVPDKGKMPLEGAAPALINWGSTRHPTLSLSDNGCRVDRFVVNTPFAEDLGSIINKILFDERIQFKVSQQISFEAHIATPSGKVILK